MTTITLLDGFSCRGIVISLDGDRIDIDGPSGAITADDVAIVRQHKPEIMDYLRSHLGPASNPETSLDASLPDPCGTTCQFCGSAELFDADDPPGILCDVCGQLIWIDEGESLQKVGCRDLEAMSPNEIPACGQCSRLCDTELVSGDWQCSRCDPRSKVRRRETYRMIERAERIRRGKRRAFR